MLNSWRRFWQLSSSKKLLALEVALALLATRTALRLLGPRLTQKTVEVLTVPPRRVNPTSMPADFAKAREIAEMETAVARRLASPANCLENSLATWTLLRSRGIDAQLHFGARKNAGQFEAHAWVRIFRCSPNRCQR